MALRIPHPPKWGPRCQPRTRTAFAVLPGYDGLLLSEFCGLVASRCRPWGLPGFAPVAHSRNCNTPDTPPDTDPSELFPPLRPSSITPTLLPGLPKPEPLSSLPNTHRSKRQASQNSWRQARPQGFDPHRVRCLPPCCHDAWPDALMGFSDSGLSPTLQRLPPETLPATEVTNDPRCKHRSWRHSLPAMPLARHHRD